MKYVVIKTHAKTQGNKLYKQGEIYEDIEESAFKLKKGIIKEFKGQIKTKEEKVTRRTKKK